MEILNLIPDYYIRQRVRYRVDLMCVILFAVVMGAIMVVETVSRRQLQESRQEYLSVNKDFKAAAEYVNEFFALQVERDNLMEEVSLAASMEDTVPLSYIIGVITNARTGSLCLTSIRGMGRQTVVEQAVRVERSDQLPPPEVTRQIIRANLQGLAKTHQEVNQFVETLAQSPIMDNVQLKYYRNARVAETECLSFEIDIQCRTDIDVLQLLKAPPQTQPASGPAETQPAPAPPGPDGGGS